MTEAPGNMLKRLRPEDDDFDGQKRARSNNGSPRPTTPMASSAPAGGKLDMSKIVAEAKARAAASQAKQAPPQQSVSDRIAALKAQIAAKKGIVPAQSQQRTTPTFMPPAYNDDSSRGRGGLNIGLHPDLLAETQRDAQKSTGGAPQPRFTSSRGYRKTESPAPQKAQLEISGPSLEDLKENPYFDVSLETRNVLGKGRNARQLIFNEKGKYVQQAAALRRQAQLEAVKRRIADHARRAGMEEDLDTEKAFVVPAPPELEWWDEGLVSGKSYDAISDLANLKIETPDSIITIYIQHPVLIEPPQEKNAPAPKPMYLTSVEQAKVRRQRRKANLQEQQAKVRLGLEPPPPPKVKKGNLMRVLGEEAVKDPTAVEARVNREIAERHQHHVEENQNRKLNKDQKAEKLARQQAEDAAKGIHVRVYKIDSLANGKHRYQISINAEQYALTGVCIMHPKLNLVVVEGGEHSIRNYDKLMQNRVHWTEMEAPRAVEEGNRETLAKWLDAYEDADTGELKDLSLNKCEVVFRGEAKQRMFKRWIGARVCETDAQAKDVLGRAKMENFWALAKTFRKDF